MCSIFIDGLQQLRVSDRLQGVWLDSLRYMHEDMWHWVQDQDPFDSSWDEIRWRRVPCSGAVERLQQLFVPDRLRGIGLGALQPVL